MTILPAGYKKKANGDLVPIENIREQDLLRDQVVNDLVPVALKINQQLVDFKKKALSDIDDLVTIAGERYGAKIGGNKGNVSLISFDGQWKVTRTYREVITFTEEIEAAKALIDECLIKWSKGASSNLRAIVTRAFRTNTKGEIKTGKVLDLMRVEIEDITWEQAMMALRDAMIATDSAVYVRVYKRVGVTDQYQAVSLDMASA